MLYTHPYCPGRRAAWKLWRRAVNGSPAERNVKQLIISQIHIILWWKDLLENSYDWWNLYCNLAYFLMYHLLAGVLLKIKNRKFLIATLKIDLFLCKNITSDIGFNVFLSTLSKKTVNSCQDCQSIFCDISQEILFGFQWHGKYVILSNKLHSNVILNKSYWFFFKMIAVSV